MRKRTIFIILTVVLVVSFASLGVVRATKSKKQGTGMQVKTTQVVKQDIESNIFTSGTVVTKYHREITSDLAGKIKSVFVEEGDKVKKGDLLASLDSEDIEYELNQSQIKLEIAKDKLNRLRKEDKRNLETTFRNAEIEYKDKLKTYQDRKDLLEAGVISKKDLDEAKSSKEKAYNDYLLAKKKYDDADNLSEVRMQEKEIRSMELSINKKKSDTKKTNIMSPIDGTITEKKVSDLSIVDSYTLMFKIEDTDNLEVVTNISEYDIGKIKLGQPVKVTNDGMARKEYKGTVTYIAPNAFIDKNGQGTETVVKVKIDINDKNTGFKPNFTANVEINTANKKDVLVLPHEAIYTEKGGEKCVFLVKDNKAKKIAVETGIEGDMIIEIIADDLKEEDVIILNPTERIKDGESVNVNMGS